MRRGRGGIGGSGSGTGGNQRGRGRFNMRRDGPMKFEKDFDFESANAQFNKEEIDREFQSKLKIKGAVQFLKVFSTSCLYNKIYITITDTNYFYPNNLLMFVEAVYLRYKT